MSSENRRDVSTRKINFFHKLAQALVRLEFSPNQISILSSAFALAAGLFLYFANISAISFLLLSILFIQLRLICNLIDGLMAVEGGLKTKSGEIFNDVPDRFSDAFIIIGAAYWANLPELGYIATIAAIMTAYVRTLGASMTGHHDFSGPMAKQHRMFLVTLGAVGGIFEFFFFNNYLRITMKMALSLVLIGSLFTVWNRLLKLYRKLES